MDSSISRCRSGTSRLTTSMWPSKKAANLNWSVKYEKTLQKSVESNIVNIVFSKSPVDV